MKFTKTEDEEGGADGEDLDMNNGWTVVALQLSYFG